MAKISINPITSGNNLETSINQRLQQIEDTFNDNILWRDGFVSEPNQMEVDLDMNSNDILNLLELTLSGVKVKESIETNQADIVELKNAVNLLWPRGSTPFPTVTIDWGDISGNIVNQADLHAWLVGHDASIATNVADIAALDVRVTANEGDITALDGRVTTAEANITSNDGDIAALDGRLTTAEGNITSNDVDIAALDVRVTANEGDITALEAADITLQSNIDAEETARIAADALKVDKAGDTMTGQLNGITPTADANLTRKDYVDEKAVNEAIAFAIALGG